MTAAEVLGLSTPVRLWARREILARPRPVPAAPGVYAWWFDALPDGVPTAGAVRRDEWTLAYVGIAPRKPSAAGRESSSNLQKRLVQHARGPAGSSTVRRTLAAVLADELDLPATRSAAGKVVLGAGEERLNVWMDAHARVCWVVHPEPWHLEDELIATVPLALNLLGNSAHPFHAELSLRRAAQGR